MKSPFDRRNKYGRVVVGLLVPLLALFAAAVLLLRAQEPPAVQPEAAADSFAAGSDFSVLSRADGSVWTWGYNEQGQLGLGTSSGSTSVANRVHGEGNVGSLSNVTTTAAGWAHGLAVKSDGTVWAWGLNGSGRLGDNTTTARTTPVPVHGPGDTNFLTAVYTVAAGEAHSVALKFDGTIWVWGDNGSGQLGDNTQTTRKTPIQVHGSNDVGYLTDIMAVAAGRNFTYAVQTNGDIWAWGANAQGQLGDGTTAARQTPVRVHSATGLLAQVSTVAGGWTHGLAVKTDGTVWAWGDNTYGKLGDNTTTTRTTPVQVHGPGDTGFLSNVVAVAVGRFHSLAVKADGTVWAWGDNSFGRLGDNTTTEHRTPVQVHGCNNVGFLSNVVAVAAGERHSLALMADGTVWTWGNNAYGDLGDGTTEHRYTPVLVDSDNDGLRDDWELAYFGNLNQLPGGDPDNDGLTNLQEWQHGTDPLNPDTDGDEVSDGAEVNAATDPNDPNSCPPHPVTLAGTLAYAGCQGGRFHVVAAEQSNGWSGVSSELISVGDFTLANVIAPSNYWIRAYRDANGNGVHDYWEPYGELTGNPLAVTHSTTGLSIVLTDPDSDGDGLSDWLELQFGRDPLTADNYSLLPFLEQFETNTVTLGDIHGQHNWAAMPTGIVCVQTNKVHEGSQALRMDALLDPALVQHLFVSVPTNTVWLDFWTQAQPADAAPEAPFNASAVFYFNNVGRLVVYNGWAAETNRWQVLTNTAPLAVGDWVRLTLKMDYAAQAWMLALNSTPLAAGLGFAVPADRFTAFSMQGRQAVLDQFLVATNMPTDISLDGDSLPDAWELQYFGNTAQLPDADPDHDGLTNLQEYLLGTNPNDADTDHDGLSDSWEIALGTDPKTADPVSHLPFVERFETNTVTLGDLNGQHNWASDLDGVALVQTGTVHEGQQALELASGDAGDVAVRQLFSPEATNVVWLDFWTQATPAEKPLDTPPGAAAFFFDAAGRLNVYDGLTEGTNQWQIPAASTPLASDAWVRVSLRLNYHTQSWRICLDGELMADDLGFATPQAAFSTFLLQGRSGYLDQLTIATNVPPDLDLLAGGLPDDWQMTWFGNLDQPTLGDPDQDGAPNLLEYLAGTDPTSAASHPSAWLHLSVPANAAVPVGADLSPAALGTAVAQDDFDPAPVVTYADSYVPTSLWQGLSAFYRVDERPGMTQAANSALGTNPGTILNAASGQPGVAGNACAFNGSNSCIQIANVAVSNTCSLALWLKTDQPGGVGSLWTQGSGLLAGSVDGIANDFGLSVLNGNVAFGVGGVTIQGTTSVNDGAWHHVAAVRGAAALQLYVDGVLQASAVNPGAMAGATVTLRLGSLAGSNYFSGSLDEVGCWNRALTAEEVLHLRQRGLAGQTIAASEPWQLQRLWQAADMFGLVVTGQQNIVFTNLMPDADGDGLTDYEEVANGTNPQLVDTDGDGLSDYDEILLYGTDPTQVNGYLTREVWTDIAGSAVTDLTSQVTYPDQPNSVDCLTDFLETPTDWADDYGQRVFGWFSPPRTGDYVFYIASDNEGELWLSTDDQPTNSQLIARMSSYTTARNWYQDSEQQSAPIHLEAGRSYYLEALHKEGEGGDNLAVAVRFPDGRFEAPVRAGWFRPPPADINVDSNSNGYTDYEESAIDADLVTDTDADGIPDSVEMLIYGTNPLKADTDDDNIPDIVEIRLGTDPCRADTDGDGMADGVEVDQAGTDPLTRDFNGLSTDICVLDGSAATTNRNGLWSTSGTAIYSSGIQGWLEYQVALPVAGVYGVEIEAAQHNPLSAANEFDLELWADGLRAGRQILLASQGASGRAIFFLPELAAGTHTLRLIWHNITDGTFLEVRALRVKTFGGPDADNNGVPDWLDYRRAHGSAVTALPAVSLTSPVCLEGKSRFPEMVSIWSSFDPDNTTGRVYTVTPAPAKGWYADVLLSPTGVTQVVVTDEDSQAAYTTNVLWQACNLFDAAYTNGLAIRQNDALLLAAALPGVTNGSFIIEVRNSAAEVLTNATLAAGETLPFCFEEGGTCTVSVAYTDGGVVTNAAVEVRVVAAAFGDNPVCLSGQVRSWECPDIPSEAVVEWDSSLTVTTNPASQGLNFNLLSSASDPAYMLARLGTNGPVLASARVNTMTAASSLIWNVIQVFPDGSALIEITQTLSEVPRDLRIEINILVGGVTFDDGTLSRVITAADFNAMGQYTAHYIRGPGVATTLCHTAALFQGSKFIGYSK